MHSPSTSPLADLAALSGDHDGLAAEAVPLQPKDRTKVGISEIPLPPAHLVDELDNSKPAVVEEDDADEPVTLDFVGDDLPERRIPQKYPFRWKGELYETITVRQLTVAQVGRIEQQWAASGTAPQFYDIYAEMTGLPAKVLRALPAPNGQPVVAAAFDFLPLSWRGAAD